MLSTRFFCAKGRLADYLPDILLYFSPKERIIYQKVRKIIITFVNQVISRKTAIRVFLRPSLGLKQVGDGCYGNVLSCFPVFRAIFRRKACKAILPYGIGDSLRSVRSFDTKSAPRMSREPFDLESPNFTRTSIAR